jgi:hypothetical protein
MDTVFVGIDVSKDRLDVHVLPSEEAFAVARDGDGLAMLNERLSPLGAAVIGIEATGGFETVAAGSLAGAGLPVVVVNPAQVRAFAQALGKRAKTDPIDAAVIARFVEAVRPEVRTLPDAATQALGDLIARRRQIVQMIVAERQREKRATLPRLKRSITRLLTALEKELSELDREIDTTVRGSPACPNSAHSTGARSQPSPGSRPGPDSPANGKARASSAAAAAPSGPFSSSAPSSPPSGIPSSGPSASASSMRESLSSSPSSP